MPKQILLVEDSVTMQKVVEITFAHEDYRIASARDAEEALARIRELRPDVILADYTLPELGAARALELVKDRRLEVPFIVVSGSIAEETAVAMIRQGAADYLLKDRLARLGPAVARPAAHCRRRGRCRGCASSGPR